MKTKITSCERLLFLKVPAKADYLSLIRLVVAGVAQTIGLPAESIADLKVALSEASSNVIRHAYQGGQPPEEQVIEIRCFDDSDAIILEVTDFGGGMTIPPPPSGGLGFGIMGSLMDQVDVETDESGTTVLMKKSSLSHRQ